MTDPKRVALVSLGCAKNLVDSEKMLGQLAEAGCILTDEEAAEVLVINTCGFLEASRTEADEVILEALEAKAQGRLDRVVVAGCLVQRDGRAILDRFPAIDALVGVHNRDDIVRAVVGKNGAPARDPVDIYLSDYHPYTQLDTARYRLTPRHYAYLRISEGCDQKCTFCTIPSIRGSMHGKPPEIVLAEARELVADGAVELHLIGQDTTSYGLGEDHFEGGLASLLRRLNDVDGLGWIRLMYVYPSVLSDEIIAAVAECDRVCKYIDIPLQHINDRVLKSMHRRIDRRETQDLLGRLRDRIPGVSIRTTMMVGFPGETDTEFDELTAFVRDFEFDALGVFAYSREPETPSGRMAGQIPESVKQQRLDELMSVQQDVAFSLADRRVSSKCRVLVDEYIEEDLLAARHQGQAPSVDSVTYLRSADAKPGSFVDVRIVGRQEYDLMATPTSITLPTVS